MQENEFEDIRASGRLPGLAIEIQHRRWRDGSGELLTLSLHADPSLAAFGRYVEVANPLLFWARLMQMAWSPWLALADLASPRLGKPPDAA